MKKILLSALAVILMMTSFSCKKKSDDSTSDTSKGLSTKIAGNTWTAATVTAMRYPAGMLITATGSDPSENLTLEYEKRATGTVQFAFGSDNSMGSVTISHVYYSSLVGFTPVGQIVVTKYDETNKLISGTFYFDGQNISGNIMHVTEGKFSNVTWTELGSAK